MNENKYLYDYIAELEEFREKDGTRPDPPPDNDETGRALGAELNAILRWPVWRIVLYSIAARLLLRLVIGHGPGLTAFALECVWVTVAFHYWKKRVHKYRFGLELTREWRIKIAHKYLFPIFWQPYCWFYLPASVGISILRACGGSWPGWLAEDPLAPVITSYAIICLLAAIASYHRLIDRLDEPHKPRAKHYQGQFLYGDDPWLYAFQECVRYLRAHPPIDENE